MEQNGPNPSQAFQIPPGADGVQGNPETALRYLRDQVIAMNKANLEVAPIFCELCGSLLNGLQEQGFNRHEAIEIIKSAVKK